MRTERTLETIRKGVADYRDKLSCALVIASDLAFIVGSWLGYRALMTMA